MRSGASWRHHSRSLHCNRYHGHSRRFRHLLVADDQAIAKADDPTRVSGDFIRVRNHDNRDSLSAVQLLEDVHDFGAVVGVQAHQWARRQEESRVC